MMDNIEINRLLAELRTTAAAAQNNSSVSAATSVDGFSDVFRQAIEGVSTSQTSASEMARAFELGDPDTSLTEVMIALQKASVSFQAMTQVRNKLVSAYQEIMNMAI